MARGIPIIVFSNSPPITRSLSKDRWDIIRSVKFSINLRLRLIDLNKFIIDKYKLLTDNRLSFPSLFIIDKEGIIQYYTVHNLLCGRSINKNKK